MRYIAKYKDNDVNSDDSDVHAIAINSVSNYSIPAFVFGSQVLFLVDTGATVSLISSEVWNRIKPANPPELKPVNMKLVGVDGSPMQVQGSVIVDLNLSDQAFQQEVIVANSLTSEGILGINFLEANGCVLDLSQGELVSHSTRVSLCARNSTILTAEQVTVTVQETFTMAPCI